MGLCVTLSSWFFLYASIRSVIAASSAEILSRSFRRGYFWVSFVFVVLHACGAHRCQQGRRETNNRNLYGLCMRLTC
jgi:hypothetical protein